MSHLNHHHTTFKMIMMIFESGKNKTECEQVKKIIIIITRIHTNGRDIYGGMCVCVCVCLMHYY